MKIRVCWDCRDQQEKVDFAPKNLGLCPSFLGGMSRVCCDMTVGNGSKLKEGRFSVDVRKKFFTMRVM